MALTRLLLLFSLITAFGDIGAGIDPNGGRAATLDNGSCIDPQGRCNTGDGGGFMDPNGGQAATADTGSCIDPNGGCNATDGGGAMDPNG